MIHACPLLLEDDTIEHIDWIAEQLAKRRNHTVTRSDAVAWLVKKHWKKIQCQKHQKSKARPNIEIAT